MDDQAGVSFPLVDSSYDNAEILKLIEVLLSGNLTMGHQVREFETAFAQVVGSLDAVMVNSGSSANLLSVAAVTNPTRQPRLSQGDRVGVPAICWSTSLWPLVQNGLVPVLIDVDPSTLNLSIDALVEALGRYELRALMLVHVLGNATDMTQILEIAAREDLILIEDTCEALGSTFDGRWLGTIGAFGTYSFYFSHHMTTIEGGMVVANDDADLDLLRCLRSHGWSRDQSDRAELERGNPHIDPRFLFINAGYNVRPMEIQGAFGLQQLQRLDRMNANRRENVRTIRAAFRNSPKWRDQLEFPSPTPGLEPAWFGFPFIVSDSVEFRRNEFVEQLLDLGVDSRPIISGNMARQPAVHLFPIELGLGPFVGADRLHDRGIFVGAHSSLLDSARIERLVDTVLACLGDRG